MRRTNWNFEKSHWAGIVKLTAAAILFTGGFATTSSAQQQGQKTFSSAEEASRALVTAAKANDEQAVLNILGPDGKQIVSSGDDAEDAQNRANFAQRYQEMHRLVKEPDGTTTLYVGAENWPTPIPLKNKDNVWYFDTNAAKQEILYRRIGENELSAIRVCQELVAAEKDYYKAQHDEYAQKAVSDDGQHDGLYWKAADGQPQSPIGPLVAGAFVGENAQASPAPFRGYYFRLLAHQETSSPSARKNHAGKSAGFAFVAFPAEYSSSGVMTFFVKEDGVVYQKDLGQDTESAAKAIQRSTSRAGWQKADDLKEETAAPEQKTGN
jgi:hypothetical protein